MKWEKKEKPQVSPWKAKDYIWGLIQVCCLNHHTVLFMSVKPKAIIGFLLCRLSIPTKGIRYSCLKSTDKQENTQNGWNVCQDHFASLWPYPSNGTYLELIQDDQAGIFIVPLFALVLWVYTVPCDLGAQRRQESIWSHISPGREEMNLSKQCQRRKHFPKKDKKILRLHIG